MATVIEQPATQRPAKSAEQVITYVPLGEQESISLTLSRVKQFLCIPTRSGKMPTDEQVVKFMMLCKAQSLNPWLNDAYLVGYDGKDGPQFSLITAHQSFLKRAEASPEYEGIESGVVVMSDGEVIERQGDLMLNGEELVGAWARVHRSDRKIPSYDSLNRKTFDTGRSRWAADPAGMIVKCAEASALRKAFPSTLAAMYCKEEMDYQRESREAIPRIEAKSKGERLTERLLGETTEPTFIPATEEPQRVEEPRVTRKQEPKVEHKPEPVEATPGVAQDIYDEINLAESIDDLQAAARSAAMAKEQGEIDQLQYDDMMAKIAKKRK